MANFLARIDSGLPTPTPDHDMDDQDQDDNSAYGQQTNKRKRGPPRDDYHTILNNERAALKTYLDKVIHSRNCKNVADEDKEEMLMLEYDKKLTEREKKGQFTVRWKFPDLYDREEDREWVKEKFRVYLNRTGYAPGLDALYGSGGRGKGQREWGRDEDVDDDEPGVTAGTRKRAFVSGDYAEEGLDDSRYARISAKKARSGRSSFMDAVLESTHVHGRQSDTADAEKRKVTEIKPTIGVACTRSFAILSGPRCSLSLEKMDVSTVTTVSRGNVPDGAVSSQGWVGKRHWRWMGGKLVVWPPFDQL